MVVRSPFLLDQSLPTANTDVLRFSVSAAESVDNTSILYPCVSVPYENFYCGGKGGKWEEGTGLMANLTDGTACGLCNSTNLASCLPRTESIIKCSPSPAVAAGRRTMIVRFADSDC